MATLSVRRSLSAIRPAAQYSRVPCPNRGPRPARGGDSRRVRLAYVYLPITSLPAKGRCGITMISREAEGGWKLVHRPVDRLTTPQPLQRSIREPSTSRRAAATPEISTSSALNPAIAMDLGMLVNFGDARERYWRSRRSSSVAAASPSTR